MGVRGMGVVSPLNERRWASSEVEEVEEEGPVFDPTQGRLFKHQGEIPRLPIPDLEDTCERYLRSLEPLISDKEMLGETKEYVKEFLEGNGPSLQEELKRLDQENEKGSWVSGLWESLYFFFFFLFFLFFSFLLFFLTIKYSHVLGKQGPPSHPYQPLLRSFPLCSHEGPPPSNSSPLSFFFHFPSFSFSPLPLLPPSPSLFPFPRFWLP